MCFIFAVKYIFSSYENLEGTSTQIRLIYPDLLNDNVAWSHSNLRLIGGLSTSECDLGSVLPE